MKKKIRKIELKKQTVSLLNIQMAKDINAGRQMVTRLVDSCRKWCPTMIDPGCEGDF